MSDGDGAKCRDDADSDGYLSEACGGDDCDDSDPGIHPGPPEPRTWVTERIDLVASDGESCALAVDAEGNAHIQYAHANDVHEFRYANNRDGDWDIETIDPGSATLQQSFIAVDSMGNPRVAYTRGRDDIQGKTLRYARRVGESWEIEVVEEGDIDLDGGVALVLDRAETPHLAYGVDEGDGATRVQHATNANGTWEIEQVASGEHLAGVSLAVEEDGRLHAAYIGGPDPVGSVRLATRDDDGWRSEVIAEMGGLPPLVTYSVWDRCCTSVVVAPDGSLHVSYPSAGVGYVTNAGGTWESEEIHVDGTLNPDGYLKGQRTSIAFGPDGRLHLAWIALGIRIPALPYALAHASGAAGDWAVEIVDAFDMSGPSDASLAIDSDGDLRIAYVGADNGLVLATLAASADRCERAGPTE